jgi:hypothetical protein
MGGQAFQTNTQERSWQGFLLAPDMKVGLALPHSVARASARDSLHFRGHISIGPRLVY